jgi:hypothetical protein
MSHRLKITIPTTTLNDLERLASPEESSVGPLSESDNAGVCVAAA